jgi:hypothetical protein
MIAQLALALLLQGATDPVRAPTVSARITPESPAVGEPITITLRVRAPRGTLVRFPTLPDTGTRIEPLDPRSLSGVSDDGEVDQTATYRLIAWDTGSVDVQFADVTLERDGRVTRYPVRVGTMRIHSVLPRDTSARTPKPARGPQDAPRMPWRWFVAAAVVAWLSWWGWRRWKAHKIAMATADPGASVRARKGFAHARSLDLISAGEPGRHALAHVHVLRRYLAERWPELPESLTAKEMKAALEPLNFPILPEGLVSILETAEGVAYAGATISADDAEMIGVESAMMVEDLERAWVVRMAKAQGDGRVRRKKLR